MMIFILATDINCGQTVKEKEPKRHVAKAHDHFFRMAMSEKQVAREFFDAHLPEDLHQVTDLSRLELQPGTYIDKMRQESIADMLFKTVIE
ncbi:MAG TPA: Rpn family recombination-promoting nuclease/putative transposase [Gammaproteobacteria bacterium]|nr:Rpn family recombination-promoting nuclease/putative transposase [Gammaproteobacteria bacterium]